MDAAGGGLVAVAVAVEVAVVNVLLFLPLESLLGLFSLFCLFLTVDDLPSFTEL